MKKVIWITGGSSGIGKAVALKFANKGWQVIISSRREEVLKDISYKNENENRNGNKKKNSNNMKIK